MFKPKNISPAKSLDLPELLFVTFISQYISDPYFNKFVASQAKAEGVDDYKFMADHSQKAYQAFLEGEFIPSKMLSRAR